MKMYLKMIGGVHVILAFLKSSLVAQTARKTAAPGTGTDAPPVAQRLLTHTWPKTSPAQNIQANTKKQYNNT